MRTPTAWRFPALTAVVSGPSPAAMATVTRTATVSRHAAGTRRTRVITLPLRVPSGTQTGVPIHRCRPASGDDNRRSREPGDWRLEIPPGAELHKARLDDRQRQLPGVCKGVLLGQHRVGVERVVDVHVQIQAGARVEPQDLG